MNAGPGSTIIRTPMSTTVPPMSATTQRFAHVDVMLRNRPTRSWPFQLLTYRSTAELFDQFRDFPWALVMQHVPCISNRCDRE
jgi:hypothetical protein